MLSFQKPRDELSQSTVYDTLAMVHVNLKVTIMKTTLVIEWKSLCEELLFLGSDESVFWTWTHLGEVHHPS